MAAPVHTANAPGLPSQVCVGIVAGAHGVGGLVRIRSFTANAGDVAAYGPVFADGHGPPLVLSVVGGHGDRLIARIDGIADRNAAEALRGRRLFVPRRALPPPAEEEFYHADLIGLAADLAGEPSRGRLGIVTAVHDFGAGAILEVESADSRQVLVPFTREAVPVVDVAGGRVLIAPLPGLFGPGGEPDERPHGEAAA